jgi:hypothetical protein
MKSTSNVGPDRREEGTSLILAMVFVFVISIVLVAVGGLAANALLNTTNLRDQRTTAEDAQSAVTIAMQYLRYNASSAAPAPSCLPPGANILSSGTSGASAQLQVSCTVAVSPTSAQTRVVDFYACPSPGCAPAPGPHVLLHAQVAYNDLNAQGVDDCFSSITTSCGMGMDVTIWDVTVADN